MEKLLLIAKDFKLRRMKILRVRILRQNLMKHKSKKSLNLWIPHKQVQE